MWRLVTEILVSIFSLNQNLIFPGNLGYGMIRQVKSRLKEI